MNTKLKPITMSAVTSKQVDSIGYDASTKTLAVKFIRTPATYRYPNVSPETFAELQKAESVGSFVHQNFVKNKRPFNKIEPEKKQQAAA